MEEVQTNITSSAYWISLFGLVPVYKMVKLFLPTTTNL